MLQRHWKKKNPEGFDLRHKIYMSGKEENKITSNPRVRKCTC